MEMKKYPTLFSRRLKRVIVGGDMLLKLLSNKTQLVIKEKHKDFLFHSVNWSPEYQAWSIAVSHPDFPEVKLGEYIPEVEAFFYQPEWKSCSVWPEGTPKSYVESSHQSKEEAELVCKILCDEGFLEKGEIFPLWAWVEEVSND